MVSIEKIRCQKMLPLANIRYLVSKSSLCAFEHVYMERAQYQMTILLLLLLLLLRPCCGYHTNLAC